MLFSAQLALPQSGDYLSVRKPNGRVVKNFMPGSPIVLQTREGRYWEGPITAIQHDSLFLTIYDVRLLPTPWNSYIRDTVAVFPLALHVTDIVRIYLSPHRSFWQRSAPTLLMIAGAGYTVLNLANGATYGLPLTDKKNVKRLGISTGLFATGFLLHRIFRSDGFTTERHHIEYVKFR